MGREYLHTERVRYGDLDAMRHLNNVVYLRFFESARIAMLSELMPSRKPMKPEEDESAVIFAECSIKYRAPVFYEETVDTRCWVGEVRRSAFRVDFDMHVGERLVAEGFGWLVGFDYQAQRSKQLSDEFRGQLEAYSREP